MKKMMIVKESKNEDMKSTWKIEKQLLKDAM
jgi:hypothetical protein